MLIFERIGDHKIPAKKLGVSNCLKQRKRDKYRGVSIWILAIKIGILGKFFTRAQVVVHGTVVQESPQRGRRDPTIQTLDDKSCDSTEEVLGHCSLGTVLEQCSLGTVLGQSWDSAVLGQSRDGAVLGQSCDSLGPEQSWYDTVLGHWSWDSSLGTVVLGQWSWDSGLGTVFLGQWSWDTGLGTVVLGQ